MDPAAELGRNPVSKHQIQPEYGDEQADAGRNGGTRLARPNSQARTGTGEYYFACSADHEQDWQPYPVDPYSAMYVSYVCMVITYSIVWINRVRLPILLVVSWTGKIVFPCPLACLRIWSRETGSAVPSRVSLLISILRLNLVLTYGIPPEFRCGVHLWNRHTPSGQSRVYGLTQLRNDGVQCRESAGTGPVNLKVVPNGCCLGRSPWAN